MGIILGTQDAKNITIVNSFEIMVDNDYNVDKGYLTDRIEQCTFPNEDVMNFCYRFLVANFYFDSSYHLSRTRTYWMV